MAESPRRFPSPWRADPIPGGYVVRDANSQALAYIYSRDNEDEARQAKMLTKDEARRIAINVARLLESLGQTDRQRLSGAALGDGTRGGPQRPGRRRPVRTPTAPPPTPPGRRSVRARDATQYPWQVPR
jgi:hypothetical protein